MAWERSDGFPCRITWLVGPRLIARLCICFLWLDTRRTCTNVRLDAKTVTYGRNLLDSGVCKLNGCTITRAMSVMCPPHVTISDGPAMHVSHVVYASASRSINPHPHTAGARELTRRSVSAISYNTAFHLPICQRDRSLVASAMFRAYTRIVSRSLCTTIEFATDNSEFQPAQRDTCYTKQVPGSGLV